MIFHTNFYSKAGMRNLDEQSQKNIIDAIVSAIPKMDSGLNANLVTVKVIAGRDEGAYLWLSANYILGRLNPKVMRMMNAGVFAEGSVIFNIPSHATSGEEDAFLCVGKTTPDERLCRQTTYGVLDMGGASLQIAFEFDSPKLVFISMFRCLIFIIFIWH